MSGPLVRRAVPLSARQLHAIRTWQRTDRSYGLVQGIMRGDVDPASLSPTDRAHALELIADLAEAIASGRTTRPVTVYRGIRSLSNTFKVDRPDALPRYPAPLDGFSATSIHREIAATEFVTAAGAVLELDVPAGMRALWVAGAGDEQFRYQGELLLDDQLRLAISDVRRDGQHLVICAMVIGE
jgi:hypothetical protein